MSMNGKDVGEVLRVKMLEKGLKSTSSYRKRDLIWGNYKKDYNPHKIIVLRLHIHFYCIHSCVHGYLIEDKKY